MSSFLLMTFWLSVAVGFSSVYPVQTKNCTSPVSSTVDFNQPDFNTTKWQFYLEHRSSSYQQAEQLCQNHLGILFDMEQSDDNETLKNKLNQDTMCQPIWVGTPKSPARHFRQSVDNHALLFPVKDESYARVNVTFPMLSAVTVCLRVQFSPHHENISALFSYAARECTNEFQVRGRVDKDKKNVLLVLIIQEKHYSYKAWFPNDADWHHICVSWQKSDGFWAIYVDGDKRDSGNHLSRKIYGHGLFILGQDQDSYGGDFSEPFFGNMTDINIWDTSLDQNQIRMLFICSSGLNLKLLFHWQVREVILNSFVKKEPLGMSCPGLSQSQKQDYCRVLHGFNKKDPVYNLAPCSYTLPFICIINKEQQQKMKSIEEDFKKNPSTFGNYLNQQGTAIGESKNWSSAVNFLNVTEGFLQKKGQFESKDVLILVNELAAVATLSDSSNQSSELVQSLSHSFINIADSLISQQNSENWKNSTSGIGPMKVVQSVDNMMSMLSSKILEKNDSFEIKTENIKLQVQQKLLTENLTFCSSNVTNDLGVDCISVTNESVQALKNKGLSKITVLNAWYGSLAQLLDGSRTVMSSVISSKSLGGHNLGVEFTLHHQNAAGDPDCSFWNFDDNSGSGNWSTYGCEVKLSTSGSTTCYCNHTTNFALLLRITEVQGNSTERKALEVFSIIGSVVSLCALVFTFILFVFVGVPKSDRTTVHKNLIVALAVAQFLFLFSDLASADENLCLTVTALLHFFFLSSFCWMLVEGLLLWSKVVTVNIGENRRMWFYYALGWGLPVFIVVVTFSMTLKKYKSDQHCWLNTKDGVIWAFVGPVLIILTANTVVLGRVIMVTVFSARRRTKMLAPSSVSKPRPQDLTWAATRPVLILMPVLGLTWFCGMLVHLSEVLEYLFIALNAFQGFYIFLVYAVYNSEVRNAIKRIRQKRKALMFTNCSQPFDRTTGESWVDSFPTPSSPECSSSSHFTNSTSSSLVFKNENFLSGSFARIPVKRPTENQVVEEIEACKCVCSRFA